MGDGNGKKKTRRILSASKERLGESRLLLFRFAASLFKGWLHLGTHRLMTIECCGMASYFERSSNGNQMLTK